MPDAHVGDAPCDAEILDRRIVRCVRVEDGGEVGGGEVRVGR